MEKKGFFYMKNTLILIFLILLILSIPPVFAAELNQTLLYDGNGNLIAGDGKHREYNEFNQLIRVYNGSINDSDEILEEYVYHPTEDRILISFPDHGSIDPREAVVYVNKNLERVYDNLGGAPHVNYTYYVFDETGIVGQITKNISYYEEGSPYYQGPPIVLGNLSYHNDYSGSVSLITNSSGGVVEETFYEPFGGILIGGNASRYSYEGKEFDSLTEDYDFHFRKYDPGLMIFTQPDSVVVNVYDPQTLNRYAFERNNPYKYVDEDGKYVSPLDILDYISLVQSTIQLIKDPSLGNLGWFVLDLTSAAVPIIGGFGVAGKAIKYGSKAVDAADTAKDMKTLLKDAGVAEDFYEFEGKRIYKNENLNLNSKSNIQDVLSGRSPKSASGETFNLHHLESGNEFSDLAIVVRSDHQTITSNLNDVFKQANKGTFNFGGKEYKLQPTVPSQIDRVKFNKFRQNFWRSIFKK